MNFENDFFKVYFYKFRRETVILSCTEELKMYAKRVIFSVDISNFKRLRKF